VIVVNDQHAARAYAVVLTRPGPDVGSGRCGLI